MILAFAPDGWSARLAHRKSPGTHVSYARVSSLYRFGLTTQICQRAASKCRYNFIRQLLRQLPYQLDIGDNCRDLSHVLGRLKLPQISCCIWADIPRLVSHYFRHPLGLRIYDGICAAADMASAPIVHGSVDIDVI